MASCYHQPRYIISNLGLINLCSGSTYNSLAFIGTWSFCKDAQSCDSYGLTSMGYVPLCCVFTKKLFWWWEVLQWGNLCFNLALTYFLMCEGCFFLACCLLFSFLNIFREYFETALLPTLAKSFSSKLAHAFSDHPRCCLLKSSEVFTWVAATESHYAPAYLYSMFGWTSDL